MNRSIVPLLRSFVLSAVLAAPAASGAPGLRLPGFAALGDESAALRKKFDEIRARGAKESAERALFQLTVHEGKRMFSIERGQLDKAYLLSTTIAEGLGEKYTYSGQPLGGFLVAFRRAGDRLELLRLNHKFRAAPGTPESAAVRAAYPDSPLASAKIAYEHPEQGYLVAAIDDFFLADLANLRGHLASNYSIAASALSPVKEQTRMRSAASYKTNVEFDALFAFAPQGLASSTLPDSRLLRVAVRYGVSLLPDAEGFEPRAADPRVGYFETKFRDYSDPALKDKRDPATQVIHRWRLEKKDPAAPVSEVKKPIVWWLDEAIPHEWRPAIRQGVLAWNEAFEAAGYRGALVVKEVDKDMSPAERRRFDPADASYNMVRWFMGTDANFAFGPSRVNPLTGEIYNAAVMLSDVMIRLWDASLAPQLASAKDKRVAGHAAAAAELAALGATEEEKRLVMTQFMESLVAHEIGHTLGLRHNFKGSAIRPLAEMGAGGVNTSSVMDYMPMHLPEGGEPKFYYQTKPGAYDRYAIEYGYKPVAAGAAGRRELEAIAKRADKDAELAYGTDEDVKGIDPDAQRFDYSSQPVRYARTLTSRAERLWRRAASDALDPSIAPGAALGSGLRRYTEAVDAVLPVIGGVRSDRRPRGEPNRMKPVHEREQRAALEFLQEKVFAKDALAIPEELILRTVPDPAAGGAGNALLDAPALAQELQRKALSHVFSGATARRLVSHRHVQPRTALPLNEVYGAVRRSVWSELEQSGEPDIALLRRQLQKDHVRALRRLAADGGAPDDARALARASLSKIEASAAEARKRSQDELIQAHLDEVIRAIKERVPAAGKAPAKPSEDEEDDHQH